MRNSRSLAVSALILLLGCFLFWSNFVIQTENVTVHLRKLPDAFDGFRIVELADLHGRKFDAENQYLLQQVQLAKPDLICLDGDIFDENSDLSILKPLIESLSAIAPTFYVTGNHEWRLENLPSILSQLEQYGAHVLRNEYVALRKDGQTLIVAGVDDPCSKCDLSSELVRRIRREEGENACIVMLAHRNDTLAQWAQLDVDLVLSGHCHGGVVRLPLIGAVFGTKRELFPDFDAGLYEKDGTQLFVSRGLGYTNVHLRLFNRPHLPVLELVNNS